MFSLREIPFGDQKSAVDLDNIVACWEANGRYYSKMVVCKDRESANAAMELIGDKSSEGEDKRAVDPDDGFIVTFIRVVGDGIANGINNYKRVHHCIDGFGKFMQSLVDKSIVLDESSDDEE